MNVSEGPIPKVRRGGWLSSLRTLAPSVLSALSVVGGLWFGSASVTLTAVAATPNHPPAPQAAGIPPGYESYLRRPDILKLTPRAHPELGKDWESLKRGHVEAVVQLLEMYPDRELYFLARDSELLYDLARILAQGHPEREKRLHLLNVSRVNMRAPHVREYLAQEGISEATLRAGKKVLFVDTGFSGTIPRVISELFPAELRGQLQAHLMSSSNPEHPSTLGFLAAINPAAPGLVPGSLHGSIVAYEHISRRTRRAVKFALERGFAAGGGDRWVPISPVGASGASENSDDGQVSPEKAQAYQEDLAAYARSPEARELIAQREAQWKKLRELSQAPGPGSEALASELRSILASNPKNPFTEALVRDYLNMQRTNLPAGPPISASALGLSEVAAGSFALSNKNALIQKYPEWASVLEEPKTGIAKLIAAEEWGKLGAITDVIQDEEFTQLLVRALGHLDSVSKPGLRPFVRMLLDQGRPSMLRGLALSFFSKPHTAEMRDLLKLLIEKGDEETLEYLAGFVFRRPHTAEMEDLLRLLIVKGGVATLKGLAIHTFSQPHTARMTGSLRFLIEKGDQQTLSHLASDAFSQPHTAEMQDLLTLLIERGDPLTLRVLASDVFSQPHTAKMARPLKLLIEKGDSRTHQTLATRAFSQPHTAEMRDLLQLLIERGDPETLLLLAKHAFSKPHWEGPAHASLRNAIQIQDPVARKAFLQASSLSTPPTLPAVGGGATRSLKASCFDWVLKLFSPPRSL